MKKSNSTYKHIRLKNDTHSSFEAYAKKLRSHIKTDNKIFNTFIDMGLLFVEINKISPITFEKLSPLLKDILVLVKHQNLRETKQYIIPVSDLSDCNYTDQEFIDVYHSCVLNGKRITQYTKGIRNKVKVVIIKF